MGVQPLAFGKDMPGMGGGFLRMKEKGDKVQFRIIKDPVYTGKHFIQTETGWNVTECKRVSSQEECENCNKFFEIKNKIKLLKEQHPEYTNETAEVKTLDREARQYSASIEFYFPILDREDGTFKILQTTYGVRNKFNAQFEAGVDVFDTEWILMNTGSASPAERYMISPVDSSKVSPLSEGEKDEIEKGKAFDMGSLVKKESDDDIDF